MAKGKEACTQVSTEGRLSSLYVRSMPDLQSGPWHDLCVVLLATSGLLHVLRRHLPETVRKPAENAFVVRAE